MMKCDYNEWIQFNSMYEFIECYVKLWMNEWAIHKGVVYGYYNLKRKLIFWFPF